MKTRWIVSGSVVAGAVLGAAITWAEYRHSPQALFPDATQGVRDAGGEPKLLIDSRDHDFGYVDRNRKIRHAFRLTNVGTGLLTIKAGPTSCSACTIAEMTRTRIPPGESAEVVVEYVPRDKKPSFRHSAYVLTNDPQQSRVELSIRGIAMARYTYSPSELVFSRLSANQSASAELKVLSFVSDELRVFDPQFTSQSIAGYFEAKIEPMSSEEAKKEDAKSGYRVLVTVKPGLPLGPFRQTIRVKMQLGVGKETELSVPIEGTVVSDLTIVGRGWRNEAGVLTLDSVDASQGVQHPLMLLVRGEHRHEVQVELVRSDPAWLRVTAGSNTVLNESLNQIPLTVEVPPGSPSAVYLGNDQGKYAELVLGVKNHPDVKEIKLHVKLVVGNKK